MKPGHELTAMAGFQLLQGYHHGVLEENKNDISLYPPVGLTFYSKTSV